MEKPAVHLKYRFGDLTQMKNHLHVVEGRTLLFYRDPKLPLPGGSRVVVELSLATSEQVSTVRGAVVALVEAAESAGNAGLWLEVPDARLAKRIDQEGPTGLSSRLQRRLGCDFVVEVRSGQVPFLGRMIDVSMSGARISGAVGLRAGGQVEMRLLGGEPPLPSLLGRCDVIRAEPSGDTGVRFVRSDPTARIASGKLFLAVQEAWNKAPELMHPALCCKGGHVLEPPLPHMKHRI